MSELKALNIAVLQGGNTREAEVSRTSAGEVADALVSVGHHVRRIDLGPNLVSELVNNDIDVVFPALHGPPGEDGTVQGLLEMLALPYVGAGVHGSAVAMDKSIAKAVFRRCGLPVAEELLFSPAANFAQAADQVKQVLGNAVVVKPGGQGSALGVTPLPNGGDVAAALAEACAGGNDALVEPYVMGREITVGILDLEGEAILPLPVIEIRTAKTTWYDYEHRYTAGASEHIVPAPLSDETTTKLQDIAKVAHESLKLRDLSRADFIVTDDEEITLLEVNTMPGMTPTSLFPDAAAHAGLSFAELMNALVASALRRAS